MQINQLADYTIRERYVPPKDLTVVTRSLVHYGFPTLGITLYGVVYDLQTGKKLTEPCKENKVRIRRPDNSIWSAKVTNLVAWAWWSESKVLWKDTPYAEYIAVAQQFNLLTTNYKKRIEWASNKYGGHYWIDRFGDLWCDHPIMKMSPPVSVYGYKVTSLGPYQNIFVHRLVADYFCEVPERLKGISKDNLMVNHKDGNKLNNCWTNLEWCTPQENSTHAVEHKLTGWKIPPETISKIWQMLQDGWTNDQISQATGVPSPTVGSIRQGVSPRYRTNEFTWRRGSQQNPAGTNRRQ